MVLPLPLPSVVTYGMKRFRDAVALDLAFVILTLPCGGSWHTFPDPSKCSFLHFWRCFFFVHWFMIYRFWRIKNEYIG